MKYRCIVPHISIDYDIDIIIGEKYFHHTIISSNVKAVPINENTQLLIKHYASLISDKKSDKKKDEFIFYTIYDNKLTIFIIGKNRLLSRLKEGVYTSYKEYYTVKKVVRINLL
jgi:hypothetical protein